MKFGRVAVAAADGFILAHSIKARGIALRKGEVLGGAEIAALEAAGISSIVGARLERGDIAENIAAQTLAKKIAGAQVRLERPFTGRCNLLAACSGLVCVAAGTIDAVNAVDESITVATLPAMQPVRDGEMIATIKVIPFAVPEAQLAASLAAAATPAVAVAPYLPLRVGVVSTLLPALKTTTIEKTLAALESRLAPAGAAIAAELRVQHEVRALAEALDRLDGHDLIVVFGASAITDRRDVVPAAVEMAGGLVDHLGMPVDPGNLLMLGRLDGPDGGGVPVIGAPGCARSPKENGFDFVLRRFLVGLDVRSADLRRMGVGGLLGEIVSRPQRRQAAPE